MAIDHVHDLQNVYRKLLHSMSRPGTISSLQELAVKNDAYLPSYNATFLVVMALFDAEVTFHVLPESRHDFIEKVSEYTLAVHKPINEADFVIVLEGAAESEVSQAMAACKKGSLIDPQASATWIIESSHHMKDMKLRLTGPGIKDEAVLHTTINETIWQARNQCVKEYPLGIDCILVDAKAQIVCVPRTTKVEVMEWAMLQ